MEMKGHKGHHHRRGHAEGGKVEPAIHPKAYDGAGSNVEREAEEKKHGGRARHERKHGGRVEGHHSGHKRLDRRHHKRGGRAGADMAPLSTASKVSSAEAHKATEGDASEGP